MHTTFRGMRATLRARPTRVKAGDDTLARLGEVSEWSKERDWKSRTCCKVRRGFKSRPLRYRHVRNQVPDVSISVVDAGQQLDAAQHFLRGAAEPDLVADAAREEHLVAGDDALHLG